MHAIATTILALATMAGEEAAEREYDALTPETARAILRRGSDIVPDYAGEAARIEVASQFKIADPSSLRGTRIERAATQAWAASFRAAWPAEDERRFGRTSGFVRAAVRWELLGRIKFGPSSPVMLA